MTDTKVTRFEVIDHRSNLGDNKGRVLVALPVNVELVYQDDGQTLKVFLTDMSNDDADKAYKAYTSALKEQMNDGVFI